MARMTTGRQGVLLRRQLKQSQVDACELRAPAGCCGGGTGDCARLPVASPGEGGREVRGPATPGCAEHTRSKLASLPARAKMHPQVPWPPQYAWSSTAETQRV